MSHKIKKINLNHSFIFFFAINFLSNKSNFFEDLEVILKMPKWKFLKELI